MNSSKFRMIIVLSVNICTGRKYVIVQQYLKRICKNNVCLRDATNKAEIYNGS